MDRLLGLLNSVLPERWRRVDVEAADVVLSGALQGFCCSGVLLWQFQRVLAAELYRIPPHFTGELAEKRGETALMAMGALVWVQYAVQPMTVLLAYFAFEGLIRCLSGIITGQTVSTLPAKVLEVVVDRLGAQGSTQAHRKVSPQKKLRTARWRGFR